MNKFIFLDFDGVMHRHGKPAFHRAQYFADIISKFDDVGIVFSTSWREYSTLDKLKSHMPQSIHHRCIGMTPVIRESMKHPRYHEILLYNNNHGISNEQWIALDDMDCLFPKDCPNLILIDGKQGFSKVDAKKLIEKLTK